MTKKRVVMVGCHPLAIDYADPAYAAFPHLNAENIQAGLDKDCDDLNASGYDAVWILWDKKPGFEEIYIDALTQRKPDAVMIGAGIRYNPGMSLLFETLVTLALTHAPQAKICFNSSPFDSAEAVRRVIG